MTKSSSKRELSCDRKWMIFQDLSCSKTSLSILTNTFFCTILYLDSTFFSISFHYKGTKICTCVQKKYYFFCYNAFRCRSYALKNWRNHFILYDIPSKMPFTKAFILLNLSGSASIIRKNFIMRISQ